MAFAWFVALYPLLTFLLFLCGCSLMQQIPPELEQCDGGPYLQQNSPPIDLAIGFSGIVICNFVL